MHQPYSISQHHHPHQQRTLGAQRLCPTQMNEALTTSALPRLCYPLAKQLTEMSDTTLEILIQALWEHREASLPKKLAKPTKAKICSGIKTQYLRRACAMRSQCLKGMDVFWNQQHNPLDKQPLPSLVEPTTLYPESRPAFSNQI
jgi:hypothetical protein